MTKIARLTDGYYVNFDDHCLYSKDGKVVEIKKRRLLEVLEYMCSYPNCYKQNLDINKHLDEGCLADVTIRNYIFQLRDAHPIIRKVLDSNSSGYIYKGSKIEDVSISDFEKKEERQSYSLEQFLSTVDKYEIEFLKTLMYCQCKWGACTLDEEVQNTNTCEGLLAILSSIQKDRYIDVIDEAVDYLFSTATDRGLVSKSLDEETVVPTSMLVLLAHTLNHNDIKVQNIADALWNSRAKNGWGLYVRDMGADSNIGCTYWAIRALHEYNCIPNDDFQKYLRSLFRYEDSYVFGHTIDDYRSKMPKLYATSMMYLIYDCLSDDSKKIIGERYNSKDALAYIVEHFDDLGSLIEGEGINGVEAAGKTWVHTVNWNHMSINYALTALSLAIKSRCFIESELLSLLQRIEKVLIDNCDEDNGLMFWSAPTISLDKGKRGKLVFPTMHMIMGISSIRDAVRCYLNEKV